jgi:hypothetical protein
MLSFQERKERILNTTHIVSVKDSTVYVVHSINQIGSNIYINSGCNLFQDTEVMTLEEACDGEIFLNKIKKLIIIK